MRFLVTAALVLVPLSALAEPTEVVVEAGSTAYVSHPGGRVQSLQFDQDHLIISRSTAEELAVGKRLAKQLEADLIECARDRARAAAEVEERDDAWSGWRWAAVGAAAAGAFAAGAWVGSR